MPYRALMKLRMHAVGVAAVLTFSGCSGEVVPITTFQGFCDAVHSPPDPNAFSSKARSFAPDSIRASFVYWYDSLLVDEIAYSSLGGAEPNGRVLRELRRLRMVGVWNDGPQLHVANSFWAADSDVLADSYDSVVAEYRRLLSLDPKPQLNTTQECLFGAINAFFSSLTIHGSDRRVIVIHTAYYLHEHEKYDSVAAAHNGWPSK